MKPADLKGRRYGRLVALEISSNVKGLVRWKCLCDCGQTSHVIASNLGRITNSCGCLKREATIRAHTTHGGSRTVEYIIWLRIKDRCFKPSCKEFPFYGARGISMCQRWRKDFGAFIGDVGVRPFTKAQLDRIDNDGNYEPSNVRWVDKITQANNTRGNRIVNLDGSAMTLANAARLLGVPYKPFHHLVVTRRLDPRDAASVIAKSHSAS